LQIPTLKFDSTKRESVNISTTNSPSFKPILKVSVIP
jgi:hypothetical protein